jgi:hypothetical protein
VFGPEIERRNAAWRLPPRAMGRHSGRFVGSLRRREDLTEVKKLAEQKATTSVLYDGTRIFD